jgi:hypothetical protein
MLTYSIKPRKTDAVNGAIRLLALKYDTDTLPVFHSSRSLNKVLSWMQEYKMHKVDVVILYLAYSLTYKKDAASTPTPGG